MVRSLTTFPLLDGYRGAPRADVAALEDLLLRVGALVEAHPEIAEMDCNPVMVLPERVPWWSTPGSASRRRARRCPSPPAAGSHAGRAPALIVPGG